MKKRWIAGLISLMLLLAVFPITVSAAGEADVICRKMVSDYHKTLYNTQSASMNGNCGGLVGWQLRLQGITTEAVTMSGKDFYDYYHERSWTTGGYSIKDYSLEKYPTMLDALNAASYNGRKNVYNLLVGFEKTTSESGKVHGHVCFIYAILNGTVYFCESYAVRSSYVEGQAMSLSIEDFAELFASWSTYEGMVEFGKQAGSANDSKVNLFVEMLYDAPLLGTMDTDADAVRELKKGERLHAVQLAQQGDYYYYEIDDGQTFGYIPARETKPYRMLPAMTEGTSVTLPEQLKAGNNFTLIGKVLVRSGSLKKVLVEVSDGEKTVLSGEAESKNGICGLNQKSITQSLQWHTLPVGKYTVTVTATVETEYARYGKPHTREDQQIVFSGAVDVVEKIEKKKPIKEEPPAETVPETTAPEATGENGEVIEPTEPPKEIIPREDGWSYADGCWYLWENGAPVTGWHQEGKIFYYLDETGMAAAGDTEVNGVMRRFSPTGALHDGWEYEVYGTRFVLNGGILATGWCRLDGVRYHFNEDRYLDTACWVESNGEQVYLTEDGSAAEGWLETKKGKFFFVDGIAQAQFVEEKKNPQIHFKALKPLTK